jgi:site-specific DNA recombinase
MSKKILHIYTRVSTGIQEEGTSLDTQLEEGVKRANKLGMEYKLWNEGGQSGSKDDLSNRPKLMEILTQIENGVIKNLYVWNTDRLSRNINTWGMIRLKLIQHNIALHTPTGKQQLSDPQTNLMVGIMSEFSQYDNQLRTERFRLGRLSNIKKGKWKGGAPTYGYNLVDSLLVPNKLEVKWVNEIFKWYLDGDSIPKIKDRLLQNGVMTRRGNPIWSEGSIQNILTNNTHYQGFWIYIDKKSEEKIRVDCPSIVPSKTILNVKKLYESRKYSSGNHQRTPRKYKYLLKELLECGHCGGAYHGWKSATNMQNPYYSCITKKNDNRKCDSMRNLNMTNTDKLTWEMVRTTIGDSNLFKESIKKEMLGDQSIIQTKIDVKKIERKLKQNDHLIQRITESIVNQETDKLIGIRSKKEINSVLDRLDVELLKLKSNKDYMLSEISTRNQNSQWVDWINEWGSRLEKMNDSEFKFDDKKEFLKTVVDKIIVKSDNAIEHELVIKFKLPYVDDELIYKDKINKKKGYILKDGGYSKKLRISILKKN